jgi:hypothetical protein
MRTISSDFDAAEFDMIRRGDMLGPRLGQKVFDALRNPPSGEAGEVTVKPLEWDRDFGIYAETPFGNYVIYPSDQNHPEERLFLGYDELSRHGSVSEAKFAAISDYETRIRSALLPTIKEPTDGK